MTPTTLYISGRTEAGGASPRVAEAHAVGARWHDEGGEPTKAAGTEEEEEEQEQV